MNFLITILAGGARGLVELLPLSFSAHQGFLQTMVIPLSKEETMGALFSMLLHLGILVGVVLAFRKELISLFIAFPKKLKYIWNKDETNSPAFYQQLFFYSLLLILPVAGAWIYPIAFLSKNLPLIGAMLLINGGLLFTLDRLQDSGSELNPIKALAIGGARFISFIPGLSPIGGSLFAAVAWGIDRKKALLISILLLIPESLVGIIQDGIAIIQQKPQFGLEIFSWILGGLACGAVVFYAIRLLTWLLVKRRLSWLSYYIWFLAGILLLIWFRG